MGKCQRQTDANVAQTIPTNANMPTGLAVELLGVRPLTECVPEHTGEATRAQGISSSRTIPTSANLTPINANCFFSAALH